MTKNIFERKTKEDKPVLAICYDFDKTLSPEDMQAQGFIQKVSLDVKEFWRESNELAEQNDMDQNSAWMYKMREDSRGKVLFTLDTLRDHGSNVELFPGVKDWFERIKKYATSQEVIVEHYIISSGLKEMIEGTDIFKSNAFVKVFASSFLFNKNGEAIWPAQIVNYTNKTQFLFRIQKGVLDTNDQGVNDYFPPDRIRIPFRNMVYIGDSDTDIPCMKLVNSYGGHSIGVYNPNTEDKTKVYRMLRDDRIKYFVAADYTEGSQLDALIKSIIDKTRANEKLETIYYNNKHETEEFYELSRENREEREQDELIEKLQESGNFKYTHQIINELGKFDKWTNPQRKKLYNVALNNNQITWILTDADVKSFYETLMLNDTSACDKDNSEQIAKIKTKMQELKELKEANEIKSDK